MKHTVTILFKGNSAPVTLQGVEKFEVKYQGDQITNLSWKLPAGQQMLYIDLSQISFIFAVEEKGP